MEISFEALRESPALIRYTGSRQIHLENVFTIIGPLQTINITTRKKKFKRVIISRYHNSYMNNLNVKRALSVQVRLAYLRCQFLVKSLRFKILEVIPAWKIVSRGSAMKF